MIRWIISTVDVRDYQLKTKSQTQSCQLLELVGQDAGARAPLCNYGHAYIPVGQVEDTGISEVLI